MNKKISNLAKRVLCVRLFIYKQIKQLKNIMKKLKKVVGYIIISFFVILVISVFVYNIITAGWFFILTLAIGLAVMGLFLLGIHLLDDSNEADA